MLHKSVLLTESIEGLNLKKDGIYVDATLGYAGHASEILKRIPRGHLYAFDQDDYAIEKSDERLKQIANNYTIIRSNFANLEEELKKYDVTKIDGILFDLGVSSVQLDDGERGFSFHQNAKLDMRMDTLSPFSAYNVVNDYSYEDLFRVIKEYGEEKYASSIAKNIVKAREVKPIETTFELVEIIKSSMPIREMRDSHPARKTFQAIRIEVNKELDVLKKSLSEAISLLNTGGRICVITFHSLEYKIVKDIFKKVSEPSIEVKDLPYIPSQYLPKYKIINKKILPSSEEVRENNRSRSAKLTILEKIKD